MLGYELAYSVSDKFKDEIEISLAVLGMVEYVVAESKEGYDKTRRRSKKRLDSHV